MTFDLKAFRDAEFSQREKEVTLAGLADRGFGDGVFLIRGLTSEDLARAEDESDKSKLLTDLVEQLARGDKDTVKTIMEGIGFSEEVPQALKKKICHVQMGVLEPQLTTKDVVKLARVMPIEFSELSREIYGLTGMGQAAQVKQPPSGDDQTSRQP